MLGWKLNHVRKRGHLPSHFPQILHYLWWWQGLCIMLYQNYWAWFSVLNEFTLRMVLNDPMAIWLSQIVIVWSRFHSMSFSRTRVIRDICGHKLQICAVHTLEQVCFKGGSLHFRANTDILDNSLGLFHNLQENTSKKLANVYLPLESRAVTAWMVQCNKETEKVS